MNAQEVIEEALDLALKLHRGQTDKAGQPYILHPLRMLIRALEKGERETDLYATILLHDVVEDNSEFTLALLIELGFSEKTIAAVEAMTRQEGEGYEDYIERVAQNPLAARAKVYDLIDNLDPNRLMKLAPNRARSLQKRYEKAHKRLTEV